MPSVSRYSYANFTTLIMKKKLLIISPHYSTGGSCQFTFNKVELLKDQYDIKVIEYRFLSHLFVVQRNKMISLVGENFISLGDKKRDEIEDIVSNFKPDFISMEEFPEMFMDKDVSLFLYNPKRTYKIFETTHDSSFNPHKKEFFPDEFVFVSQYTALRYATFNIPTSVVEYPVDFEVFPYLLSNNPKIDFPKGHVNVVIVGLFTERKNQGYAFAIAEKLTEYNVLFHFIGNQAENFSSYWKPLMDKKPINCIIHGEKSNVEDYIKAADLFLFPSKGDRNNKELNPLVIKEAQKYPALPKLMFNLDVYLNKYNNQEDFHFLTGNLEEDASKVIEITKAKKKTNPTDEAIIIGTFPNLKKREQLTIDCINSLKPLNRKIILVSHYPVSEEIQSMVDYYIFDKENPLTHHSYYTRFYNITDEYHAEININGLKDSNQSFTVYTNLYNAMAFANKMGFTSAFYTTYDVVVHPDDLKAIEESFWSIKQGYVSAYLSTLNTPFGKGIQTTAMTFYTDYYLDSFPKLESAEEYNQLCKSLGAENFLEDFLMKSVLQWHESNYTLEDYPEETFLRKSGLGVSSNSEYYSILPIKGEPNKFMLYFFTYNIDNRVIGVTVRNKGGLIFNLIQVSKQREYKHELVYDGSEIVVEMNFEDTDAERVYKKEKFLINNETIEKYQSTGFFEWKKKPEPTKPKIKLVHLQTTINDEREQKSREQLEKVQIHNWSYIHYANEPYKELPPIHNCERPQAVSLHLFDEETIKERGTALTPAHYGCYKAFYHGIQENIDSETDFLIVCEGDCKLEVPLEEFVQKVESVCETIKNTNIGYVSFGDKATLEHGWLQSPIVEEIPNQDLIYITDHIIGLQCIMFPKKVLPWLSAKLIVEKWDAADMLFNKIFYGSEHKMAIVKERLTTQFDGYSLIDQTEKKFL